MARIDQNDWVETFVAVADHGSFSEAADVVHRSQSRVSAHVAALERALGMMLVDRRHRPVKLTDAGDEFLPHAREMLVAMERGAAAVDSLSGTSRGRVVVGAHPSVSAAFLPAILKAFSAEHPYVRVELLEDTAIGLGEGLESGALHLTIRSESAGHQPPGMSTQPLWRESAVVVAPEGHPLTNQPLPLRPRDLLGEPLVIIAEPGSRVDLDSERLFETWDLAPSVAWQTKQPQTLVSMCRAGLGIGFINRLAAEISETAGLELLPIGAEGEGRLTSLWWDPARYMSSATRVLRDAILAAERPSGTLPV